MPRVRKVPLRMCVACHQMRPKRELIRLVRTPTGEVKVDPTGKLAGRGAYVCADLQCADLGLREHRIQHALEVPISEMLADELRNMIGLVHK